LLAKIYAAHQGKLSDKWSIYLPTYERLISRLNPAPERILEIGIQNGGSLEVWARLLPQATHVIGCDINPDCARLQFEDRRIAVVVSDANTDQTEAQIAELSPWFDFIIDDGSHRSNDIVRSFARYFPRLRDGGIFVAEDLHCSYWSDFEGGLLHPGSSMAFFKRLADIINHEHWGIPKARRDLLADFANLYGTEFDESSLAHIHSVEFVNSMCIICRSDPSQNVLGPRIISGTLAAVDSRITHLSGSTHIAPDQSGNPYATFNAQSLIMQTDELHAVKSELVKVESLLQNALAESRDNKNALHKLIVSEQSVRQQFELADAQLQLIRASRSWRIAASLQPLDRLQQRLQRVGARLSMVSQHEGSKGIMLRKCFRLLCKSGPRAVRRYLKEAEAMAKGVPMDAFSLSRDGEAIARVIFNEQQSEFTHQELRQQIGRFAHQPLISILMPVYKTPVQWLARVIESLQEQVYENWELCAVDDCSPSNDQRAVLQAFADKDQRVRFSVSAQNGGISTASNVALDMARGDYVALVDHDDELTPDALFWVAKTLNDRPGTDFVYTDECKIDDTAERRLFHFIFKPKWSPELMFNAMLTGHLTVYNTDLVRRLGGFRKQFDFSQDYDLALRVAERAKQIVHIERVLYLWRAIPGSAALGGKDFARESNIAALIDSLVRQGINGTAIPSLHANRVKVKVPEGVKVSVIIPSDSHPNLSKAIEGLLTKTDYPDLEIVAVCNSPLADQLSHELAGKPGIVFSRYDKKFNFSDKCNQGARDASGDIVVFYNDDVFPIEPDWLRKLIEYLYVPGVGGVSPKLLHENELIQYAGMISGTPGLCGTAYNNVPRDASDAFLSMHKYVRNVSILSGACCAFKRAVFWQVGGFDAVNTPHGHSDMDLSFKLLEAGLRCVYTPYATLFHIGHGSWNVKKGKYKADIFMLKHWGARVSEDANFTDSMKRVLYNDFRFHYKIHASHLDPNRTYTGPDVLFVSHELTLTGAPRMLLYAAQAVLARGGFPVVVAPTDGPMRLELIQAGIAVIVDESVTQNHFLFGGFAKNFDTVVINTIALANVVKQLQMFEDLDIVWWLHEGRALQAELAKQTDINRKSVRLVCVSTYAKSFAPAGFQVEILHNAVPDQRDCVRLATSRRPFTFALPGTIEPRKGQDIFADAILRLPEDVRRNCRFVLSGKLWPMHTSFWDAIQEKMKNVPGFEYLGLLEHDQTIEFIAAADVIICSSRDESFSLTVTEAAMLGKPVTLNRHVGISEVLEDGVSCLMAIPDNPLSLSEKMLQIYKDSALRAMLGTQVRLVYERELTIKRFGEDFIEQIGWHSQAEV
jgi:glycosyltransferase involved in cell wall biosynthesis/SAM-dependent methyltransferase